MKLLHYQPSVPNFGDDLNSVLWPALEPSLFTETDCSTAFVGIGTIVGLNPQGNRRLHVFSSGAGYASSDAWDGLEVHYQCVRGPVTARLLGLGADRALTDGAILAPTLARFVQRRVPAQGVAVVPHYETLAFPGWDKAARQAGFKLVDPRHSPDAVIAAIASARLVLTESLHGAILADAFGVPWRGFAVSRNFSTAKWADWTASLGLDVEIAMIPPPDPMPLLRFGKRPEPFGTMLKLDAESALGEFRKRIGAVAPASFAKLQAKRILEHSPMMRGMLGFSPERTAEALVRLARMHPFCSDERLRASLRDEMLVRLDALARNHSISRETAG